MVEVGEKAPEFCLPNQDNVEICLRDLKGKWVILYFYPKDLTPGCTTEACEFTEAMPQFEELDGVILGVSPDSPERHRKFIEKKGLAITLLSDENKEVLKAYGAWGLKKLYGKEYEGVIRSTFIIDPEGNVAAVWPKVRVKGHVEAVKEKLQELKTKNQK
ncbi:thioredoxin-dependent thiol peroxidase [Hydrogenimonas cancrithermarum]|uniref:thioredoxin-dependent peroxiredoxin n=1 Tax=Hydrogenimonas cancrithermarum TaxID=2993563 RepID=A0ABM8FK81_9BACT|nr:thioredoxin-dependent thiol peroxidase [Hydrogenimonas cancrithermarum]BDY12730.1 peroxiredoxin [Hydrogenimonas cancrithermarum]